MTRTTSIYLDAVRVGAALCVMLYHGSFQKFGGAWLWAVFGNAGTDAVIVFFVLSGFVISYTVQTKERTPQTYFINRLARLWSVAIPALVLTVVVDLIGRAINPDLYSTVPPPSDHPLARLAGTALFVNQIWFVNLQPFSDGPFWSLSYEFWYYIFFGAIAFARGRSAILLAALAMMAMGPKILLLFPIWLMGVWVQRNARRFRISPTLAVALCIAAPAWLFVVHHLHLDESAKAYVRQLAGPQISFSDVFLTANIFGALVAAHFLGFLALEDRFASLLAKVERPVRWFAGYTLSIYLYHYPLLFFFSALFAPVGQSDFVASSATLFCTLCCAIALGSVTEKKKNVLRSYMEPFVRNHLPASG